MTDNSQKILKHRPEAHHPLDEVQDDAGASVQSLSRTDFGDDGDSVVQPDDSFYYEKPSPKERKEVSGGLLKEREAVLKEYKEPEPAKEVESWVKKVEKKEIKLPQPVYDDSGQVILDNAAPQKPAITLPLDTTGIQKGLKHKVQDSIRWLAEWCLRIIKMDKWRVV